MGEPDDSFRQIVFRLLAACVLISGAMAIALELIKL
jgi:hypothetical protein